MVHEIQKEVAGNLTRWKERIRSFTIRFLSGVISYALVASIVAMGLLGAG